MAYRDIDKRLAELAVVNSKDYTDKDYDLVPFDGRCPWCNSNDLVERELVRERQWSFLFWRAHPAYFKVKCRSCKGTCRELTFARK